MAGKRMFDPTIWEFEKALRALDKNFAHRVISHATRMASLSVDDFNDVDGRLAAIETRKRVDPGAHLK